MTEDEAAVRPPIAPARSPSRDVARGGGLEIARFGAALVVMFGHFVMQEGRVALGTAAELVLNIGWIATNFFILASGYVMVRAYRERRVAWTAFMGARLRRIYPSHLLLFGLFGISYAAALLLGISIKGDPYTFKAVIGQLLLMNSWGLGLGELWNVPTWTISALLACYALFPILNRSVRGRPRLWVIATIAGVSIASVLLRINIWHVLAPAGLVRAVPLFIVGMALAHMQGPSLRLQPGPLAARLGQVSFSLYMTHWLFGSVVFNALDILQMPDWVRWATFWLAMFVAVAVAFAWDAFVDAPIQKALRSRSLGRRAGAPSASDRPKAMAVPEPL